MPPRVAGAILAKDRIKQGSRAILFGGHAAWHQLLWLVLPLLLAFHLCIVVGTTSASTRQNSAVAAYFYQVTHGHSSGELQQHHGVVLNVLNTLLRPVCALGVLGVLMVILNLISPGVCGGSGGCDLDPFIRTTSANIKQRPSIAYQYCWVALSCTVTAVLIRTTHNLRHCKRRRRQAELLVETLTFVVETKCSHRTSITVWQENAGIHLNRQRVQLPRRAIAIILTLPLVIASSLPAYAFVMSQNLPKPESFLLVVLSNGTMIAVVKMLFAKLVVPRFAHFLTRIKYGIDPVRSPGCAATISYNQGVVTKIVFFEVSLSDQPRASPLD